MNKLIFNNSAYKDALKLSKVGMWELDLTTGNLHLSDEHIEIMGSPDIPTMIPVQEYIKEYVHEDDWGFLPSITEKIIDGEWDCSQTEIEYRIKREDELIHVYANMNLERLEENIISGITQNITASREAEIQLNHTLRHLADLKFALDESTLVTITDVNGTITYVNDKFCSISGYSKSELIGCSHNLTNSGYHSKSFFKDMWQKIQKGNIWRGEIQNKKKNGEIYWVDSTIVPFLDLNGVPYQYTAIRTDITKRKEAEFKISYMAYHDSLTGLPNRRQFTDRLNEILNSRNRSQIVGVLLFDLDNFKYINDHHGHQAGDDLLKMVSKRLLDFIRSDEMVARLGGDEFVMVIPNLNSRNDLAERCCSLIEHMDAPYMVDGRPYYISLSIGATYAPDQGNTVKELLKYADFAMYESKNNKIKGFRFYEPHQFSNLSDSMDFERAIKRNEFVLHYQPKFKLDSSLHGVEALIRWQLPNGKLLMPDKFIPQVEENGMIHEIGNWIIKTSLIQLRSWLDQGLPPVVMGINISPKQFQQNGWVDLIIECTKSLEIPPELIELEITEGVLMDHNPRTLEMLNRLKMSGIKLSLDDFGTQFSTFSYLRDYAFDILKIDRSFTKDIEKDEKSRIIIESILTLAHRLGLAVTAEGVETEAQLSFLKGMSCEYLQGFYFSKPEAAETITEMLTNYVSSSNGQIGGKL
ncbi:putative bifunctional diguanylate cyclase/phosphodiesterase [Chungangia koreensis]|uniref:Bifunctional diguanylate cyclase/phosphodiesterase n=1 Tax=Chungangia koreensis TaxID=752657 RepID=A0ABV8X3H7_9LACT